MNDTTFPATLKSAKLTARKDPDNPDTIIRRVQFTLARDFSLEQAEWMGAEATHMRGLLQRRDLHRFEIEIDGYHAKACFHGLAGNADIPQLDGVTAVAGLVGSEEDEHEEINFTFEAFPEAKPLTFLAMAVKERIDCEFKVLQGELPLDPPKSPDAKIRAAVEDFQQSLLPGDSVTVKAGGKSIKLAGKGKTRKK